MKRRGFSLLSALVLLLALTACGASGGADASGSTSAAEDNNAGWTESAAAPSEGGGTVDFAAVRQNAKLHPVRGSDAGDAVVRPGRRGYRSAGSRRGRLYRGEQRVGRVGQPVRQLYAARAAGGIIETCFAQLGETCHVVSSSRCEDEDVTEQYTDIETRLATLQTKSMSGWWSCLARPPRWKTSSRWKTPWRIANMRSTA